MKTFVAAYFAALFLAGAAFGVEPERDGQETFISRAVFADGKLWLLSDAGQIYTIATGRTERRRVALPEPAADLWLRDGKPAIATCPDKHCSAWTLRQLLDTEWKTVATVAVNEHEWLQAVAEIDGATLLLTNTRFVELANGKQRAVAIEPAKRLGPGRISSVLVRPGRILIGINAGEWGGGLRSINRQTGRTTVIESNTSGTLCGGPLNTGCDPVNGLVAEPGKPGCVLAAIGLVHFGPNGRIVEICGESVKRFYFRNLPCVNLLKGQVGIDCMGEKRDGEVPFHTEAFFGLVAGKDTAWAVGVDGLYKITPHGVERVGALPKFENYGGTWVSFATPGVVLVLTEINERVSLSGAVPMLVPR